MAEISRFYGIIIQMFGNDHNPPHFHAIFNEYRAIIEIETGEILKGILPGKQLKFIQVWTEIHKDELMKNFSDLRSEIQTYSKIKPLQ
jgi:hypothetical protein